MLRPFPTLSAFYNASISTLLNPNPQSSSLKFAGKATGASLKSADMAVNATAATQLLQFIVAIFFFHASEYVLAVAFHGRSHVSFSSLLISKQYVLAMLCALLEYLAELVLFPGLKEHWWISNIGLLMILLGEALRKAAIITARRSFTHNIRVHYVPDHKLITHGIYRFMRHPSYCGFFIWATGTQLMICNPICALGFTAITWRFFSSRIVYEEFFLKRFFGAHYVEYAQRVPSGLPFIA